MKKFCVVIEIREECAKEYVAIHNNPWREMLEAIRASGFTNEVIFYYKNQSIIFLECDDFEKCNTRLRSTDICKKWDITVCPWFKGDPAIAEKIFDLNQQLDGTLLPD
jgi:L-rhamnose mutarotase